MKFLPNQFRPSQVPRSGADPRYFWLTFAFIYILLLLLSQLVLKSDLRFALVIDAAAFLGLVAVGVAGGLRTSIGLLCLAHVLKSLVVALTLKSVFSESADSNLMAAHATAKTMFLGYCGLLGAVYFVGRVKRASKPWLPSDIAPRHLLFLTLLVAVVGYGSWMLVIALSRMGVSGLGLLSSLSRLKEFCIATSIFYAWKNGGRRLFFNPLTIGLMILAVPVAIFSTSKQEIINPFFYAGMALVSIKGFNYKPLIFSFIAALIVMQMIVYPFSQRVRYHAAEANTSRERADIVFREFKRFSFDRGYAEAQNLDVKDQVEKRGLSYFSKDVGVFSRLAMVNEASLLIAATNQGGGFTGFETLTWGAYMMVPRFIMPNKPTMSAANYLARYAGVVSPEDYETNVSFGFMANFYNAFGYPGVLIGCFLLCVALFEMIYRYCGPFFSGNIWAIFMLGTLHHSFVEAAVSGLMTFFYQPIFGYVLYRISGIASKLGGR